MGNSTGRLNLCGQVVHSLGQQILSGEIKPGQAIPQETVLCDQMGVSRTVIREAVKSLAAKGLVESRAKRGTLVLPPHVWNYLDPEVLDWQAQVGVSGDLLCHLTEFRQGIEPTAASLAAKHSSDKELETIREAFAAMVDAVDSVEDFVAADLRFHTAILHATGNPFFSPVANVISASLTSSLRVTNRKPAANRLSLPVHERVMDAICDRDPKAAEREMRSLLDDAAKRIQNASIVK